VNSGQPLTDQMLSLDHWLSYIQEVHPVGWDLGLDRVSEVGRRLKVLHPSCHDDSGGRDERKGLNVRIPRALRYG